MSEVLQNAPKEHSAILTTFIKLPLVLKTIVLSIFEWPFKTGFFCIAIFQPFLCMLKYNKIFICFVQGKFYSNSLTSVKIAY